MISSAVNNPQILKDKPKKDSLSEKDDSQLQSTAEEMYLRNQELAETNKTLSLLRTIDALVLESHTSLKMVCEHIAQAIAQTTNYPFVGLLTRSSHSDKAMVLHGYSGSSLLGTDKPAGFTRSITMDLTNDWFTSHVSSVMIPLKNRSPAEIAEQIGCPVTEIGTMTNDIPVTSLYAIKLQARRHLVGLLVVGFMESDPEMSISDTTLLDRISDSIGVALDNKLLFEQNEHVLHQLKLSNAKLKALDAAKDEFISMASHQLRTPLTSVKGNLSMVVEGDAGSINDIQQAMLRQALFSSQRMVYLISDLLNVSRLQTGTFTIDRSAVNLAKVVAEEVEQLVDIAQMQNILLTYNSPETFPKLMIDETKTRQVIMNFIDNAIHYSKPGGRIKVTLSENDSTVELHVTDDGIGVPKSEQPHLFTKFYRAENARLARPDGTGLGLFMAKKVIVAEGGSLLFRSTEEKGSDFGFIFSKKLIPANNKAPGAKQE